MLLVKVTFLNEELTEAQLQRGILWWKRLALVRLVTEKIDPGGLAYFRTAWRFAASGEECGNELADAINRARVSEKFARRARLEAKNWQRPSELPRAQVRQLPEAQADR